MLNKNDLLALAKVVAKADSSAPTAYSYNGESFSYDQLNDTLRKEFLEYAADYRSFCENKNLIFAVIEETLDDVLPKKVEQAYSAFAETKTFAQGDKPVFRRKLSSRQRAKQFITRVGLAGVYEVFKLGGSESFEVATSAIGGAAQIGFEEFLDGRADFAELTSIVMEGMDDLIYQEVAKAMITSINQLPVNNKVEVAGEFDEAAMDHLIMIAAAYGVPTIYCTEEFANKMLGATADTNWGRYSDAMKDQIWNNGRLANYKGKKVVVLPQTFVDETNSMKLVDPSYAWIIPAGANEKPVKIAFEGATHVRDVESNHDWSREIQVYKKVGVVAMLANNICVYHDLALEQDGLAVVNPKPYPAG